MHVVNKLLITGPATDPDRILQGEDLQLDLRLFDSSVVSIELRQLDAAMRSAVESISDVKVSAKYFSICLLYSYESDIERVHGTMLACPSSNQPAQQGCRPATADDDCSSS